jgi:hypothetical protein
MEVVEYSTVRTTEVKEEEDCTVLEVVAIPTVTVPGGGGGGGGTVVSTDIVGGKGGTGGGGGGPAKNGTPGGP